MNGKIYNLYQADKFMNAGAVAIAIKKEKQNNGNSLIVVHFKTDKKFYELLDKWNKHLPLE